MGLKSSINHFHETILNSSASRYYVQVEKTSKRGGKIISSDQIEQKLEEEFPKEEPQQQSVTELLKNPTKVVCLRVRIRCLKTHAFFKLLSLQFRIWLVLVRSMLIYRPKPQMNVRNMGQSVVALYTRYLLQ